MQSLGKVTAMCILLTQLRISEYIFKGTTTTDFRVRLLCAGIYIQ